MRVRILSAALLSALSVPALAVELVQPADLGRDLFDAAPITSTDARGQASEMVFAKDGTVTRKTAAGRISTGTWTLSDTGFCMKLGRATNDSCYLVLRGEAGALTAVKQTGASFAWTR
jgi:hypothetical protein